MLYPKEDLDIEQMEPDSLNDIDIQPDLNDELRANAIKITFLSVTMNERSIVPDRMCFSLRFFNFSASYTQSALLRPEMNDTKNKKYLMHLDKAVEGWTNMRLDDSNRQKLRLKFDFDPSYDPDIPSDVQIYDFLNYLAYNTMRIWIWDADGLIPIGSIKVDLKKLLRGGRVKIKNIVTYDLFSEYNEIIGSMDLKLSNKGVREGQLIKRHFRALGLSKLPEGGKTKIYSKPMTWNNIAELTKYKDEPEDEKQKDDWVYGYRMESSKKIVNRRQPFWMQEALKNEVEKYRGLSRRLNMPKIIFGMDIKTTTYPLVYYTLGCATLFPIPFISKSKFDTTYSIEIDDRPEEHTSELQSLRRSPYAVFCLKQKIHTALTLTHTYMSN